MRGITERSRESSSARGMAALGRTLLAFGTITFKRAVHVA